MCSDHPQTYSLPIKLFGRSRLPSPGQPGVSIFDIQARIGHSSPEIHAFFPRNLSIRQAIENAWADTFLARPLLTHERDLRVDACLRWFQPELDASYDSAKKEVDDDSNIDPDSIDSDRKEPTRRRDFSRGNITRRSVDWADNVRFGDATFSAQRLALFLRALVKQPDLLILDEAFSGMDDYIRDKCMLFLAYGEQKVWIRSSINRPNGNRMNRLQTSFHYTSGKAVIQGLQKEQALVCVSHVPEEVPGLVREWVCLPEANGGKAARFGRLPRPLDTLSTTWNEIWGLSESLPMKEFDGHRRRRKRNQPEKQA